MKIPILKLFGNVYHMKVQVEKSFLSSLKRLARYNTVWYKIYSFFRYDLIRFIKNVIKFRKALWSHYWFDHHGVLRFVEIGLTDIANTVEFKGQEIDLSRLKKVAKMRRAIELIKNYNEDRYIEMAEAEFGELIMRDWEFEEVEDRPNSYRIVDKETPEEKIHNKNVFNRAREIEELEWIELMQILKGQDYSLFDKERDFDEQFDGSGIKGWWD